MHYFLAETHTFKMEGKFSKYFVVFFLDLNLLRFRSGLVAKNVFMLFPAGLQCLEMCVWCVFCSSFLCLCVFPEWGAFCLNYDKISTFFLRVFGVLGFVCFLRVY